MYWGIEKSMVPAEYARTSKLPTDLDEIIVAIYYNDMVRRPDISMTPSEIRELLASQWTGVLASNGRDGFPHQVAMGYLPEPDRLLMWTYRKAQKAVNLRRDPRASFLVETSSKSYNELQGVCVKGRVDFLEDPEQVLEVGLRLRLRHRRATTSPNRRLSASFWSSQSKRR